MRRRSDRQGALNDHVAMSAEKLADVVVAVPREELAKVLAAESRTLVRAQQRLDCVRHLGGGAAIADRACDCGVLADRAADAEVVRVDEAIAVANLFSFDADVGNPMLSATVRAAGDVDLQRVVEVG